MHKVTVILISYNHAKYIKEAIDSVLNQTFKDFELIIWDDASTDSSWDIIQSYKDDRIKTFRNEETKRGIYGINKSIKELAQGEYIAIHHSDDIWESTKLEEQVKFLEENSNIGAVFTNVSIINEKGEPFKDENHFYYSIFNQPNRTRHEWLNFFFFHTNALCHPSILIRKECYETCGLYRYGIAQMGDFDMWIRLCMKYEIYILPEKLTRFRIRYNEANTSGNTISTRIRSTNEHFFILQNFLELTSEKDFFKTFPNARKYYNNQKFLPKYLLARMALENTVSRDTNLFGLTLLYELVNDKYSSSILKESYDFDYLKLIEIAANFDTFNVEELSSSIIQLSIQEKNSKNSFIRKYINPRLGVQSFDFKLTTYKNIQSISILALNAPCVIKIKKILLIEEDLSQINLINEIITNHIMKSQDIYYFDTAPIISVDSSLIGDKNFNNLIVEINYLSTGSKALKKCIKNLKYNNILSQIKTTKAKVVFFGASKALEEEWEALLEHKVMPDFICDNDKKKYGLQFKDIFIQEPESLFSKKENFIVIITSSYIKEITKQLKKYKNIIRIYNYQNLS
ncbi:glycosyltransferase [Campylobacterota bacterium DY0563]